MSLHFAILRMLSIVLTVKKMLKGMLSIWEGEPAAKRLGTDNWNSRRLILVCGPFVQRSAFRMALFYSRKTEIVLK